MNAQMNALKQQNNDLIHLLKSKFNLSDAEIVRYRAPSSKNSKSQSIHPTIKKKQPIEYTIDNKGFKIYKRPRGAARKGCEWDIYKGMWVQMGCATTSKEAELLEPDVPTEDEKEYDIAPWQVEVMEESEPDCTCPGCIKAIYMDYQEVTDVYDPNGEVYKVHAECAGAFQNKLDSGTNELCYCHICKYEVLCEPHDLPEDKEGPIVFVPQSSSPFANV
jgi:hypothetical protein